MLSSIIFFLGCLVLAFIANWIIEFVWFLVFGTECENLREYLLYLVIIWLLLTGCHPKQHAEPVHTAPKPAAQPTQTERTADSLAQVFNRSHQQSQPTLKNYNDALKSYDSIPVWRDPVKLH